MLVWGVNLLLAILISLVREINKAPEQVFIAWMHFCAVRVFTESILRYGLPPNFLVPVTLISSLAIILCLQSHLSSGFFLLHYIRHVFWLHPKRARRECAQFLNDFVLVQTGNKWVTASVLTFFFTLLLSLELCHTTFRDSQLNYLGTHFLKMLSYDTPFFDSFFWGQGGVVRVY